MGAYIDHAYPAFQMPGSRVGSRAATFPAGEKKKRLVSSNLQEKQVGDIFYLIEARPRNPWAVFGSLAFLSVLILALIVIPLFHTDVLPKRETLTMLYAPSAAASNATRLQAPMPTYTSASIGIPAPIPKTQEAPPPSVGTTGGVVGGVPGGVVDGIPGGVLSEVLSSTRSVPAPTKMPDPTPVKRIRVASRVVEANLIHDVTPVYPAEAGRARVEGTVVLLAVICTDGSVKDVRVESGLPILAQAAIDAVKQWRYKPYMVDGEPVEVDSRITINFALSAS